MFSFIIGKSLVQEGDFLMFHIRNYPQHEAEFVLLDQLDQRGSPDS